MDEEDQSEREPRPRATAVEIINSLRWPVTLLVVALLGVHLSGRACQTVEETSERPAETVERAVEAASTIAERFRSGRITTTFLADIPRLVVDGGSRLEVATFEATETFTRTDERRVAFDLIPLGRTEAEIRVPATYRYHVRLDDPWRIEVRDQSCIVWAPALRPTQPPAIHTDRMEKRVSGSWLRWDEAEQLEELHRSITPTLRERAASPETIDLVRELARRRVAEFVRNWLLIADHWREDRYTSVRVIFADERDREERPTEATLELNLGDGSAPDALDELPSAGVDANDLAR